MFPLMTTPNRAMLSIIGLYNWNDTLFSQMALPEDISRDDVINSILMECAELTVIYPDWDFMYRAINYWSTKELPTWERVYKLSQLEYNPIENYDRIENELETGYSKDRVFNASQGGNKNTAMDTGASRNQVSGFNSENLANQSGSTNNSASQSNAAGNTLNTGSDLREDNKSRASRIHGNIGVSTPADMMEKELTLYPKINTIQYITEAFKQRFCVMVY